MEHLDMVCAQTGSEAARVENITENLITRALGVLQEDGIYALFLYLLSRTGNERLCANETASILMNFLSERQIISPVVSNSKPDMKNMINTLKDQLFEDLDQVLHAKELLERVLIFARYALAKKEDV